LRVGAEEVGSEADPGSLTNLATSLRRGTFVLKMPDDHVARDRQIAAVCAAGQATAPEEACAEEAYITSNTAAWQAALVQGKGLYSDTL
jgi:hypothetical protein